MIAPVIFGVEGAELTANEAGLFSDVQPLGYIVFARNCETPQQLTQLTASLRALHDEHEPYILIDQEGGRVARMREPYWTTPPAPATFDAMMDDNPDQACIAAYENSAEIARCLIACGINVNCAPMCDIRFAHSHDIIGDRAYGNDARRVITLAERVAQGLMDHGVLPVIKHLPGHGRATADSHLELPVVDASREELALDAEPFKALAHYPFGMTAHIVYRALDAARPATLSPTVIRYIREEIGFTNLLMSDDLCMKALSGTPGALAKQTLDAGCDIVLHCDGDYAAMEQIANAIASYPAINHDLLP